MPRTPVSVSRRQLLQVLGGVGIGSVAFQRALASYVQDQGQVTREMIAQAEWIAGLELDDEDRESIADALTRSLASAERLRAIPIDADTVPSVVFRPDFFYAAAGGKTPPASTSAANQRVAWSVAEGLRRADFSDEDLAFASLADQASLLATKQLSSRELTELYLQRLRRFDPLLKCVVTLLEEHALQLADASDRRRAAGRSLGTLDGIPWVAKDLIAIPPWKTTWGAVPFQDQVRTVTATVAERLEAAGAVLLAKVSLGALAWGDRWFDGMTRNPWNPEQGSSGSSAGSAAAVAAGLATFALGSETLGSIVSPTRRCRTSGLRPTFGRVSRAGCMPLAWSMDKLGPIARYAEDLALVFPELLGADQRDPTVVQRDYQWPSRRDWRDMKIGITGERLNPTETQALEYFKASGAQLVDIELSSELPVSAMSFILGTEAATVFDDAFRADQDADYGMWTRSFTESQFVPAIQYLRAHRLRGQLIVETEQKLAQVDVVLGGDDLLLTNLTGHPSVVVACGGETSRGIELPGVVKLTAGAYRESSLLHCGAALQAALPPTPARPPLEDWLNKLAEEE